MGLLEGTLIAIGIMFVLGSFFVPDKLSKKDIDAISLLSEAELKVIVEKNLAEARGKIDDAADDAAELAMNKAERMMEKESNEKIMAISEYSDTVLESINKTHNEVMFLYSMLNDKYDELTGYANRLTEMKTDLENSSKMLEATYKQKELLEEEVTKPEKLDTDEPPLHMEDVEEATANNKEQILNYYRSGMTDVEIAKTLGIGIGAVRLIIELYKEE